MIKGSMWMVAMRWSIRGIGLVSTVILVRLLTPADFGIVAMAMLVVGLLEILSSLGVDMALIQKSDAERKHFDTAWTFQVIQGAVIALLIFVFSPLMADFFDEQRIVPVMQLMAVAVFVNGFMNIGVVAFRKELDFAREFRFEVMKKIVTFLVTVIFAFILRNYWALVIGIVTGRFIGVLISYIMHAYRPRFCLLAARELWSFSQWMLIAGIGNYINNKIDEFVVGGMKSTSQMGVYNVSADIATLPTVEVISPLSRALFPGYSKLKDEPERLASAFKNVIGMVALLGLSMSLGIVAVAEDLVYVVLGEKWMDAVPLIQWLAVFGAIVVLGNITSYIFIARNQVKTTAVIIWGYLLLLVPSVILAGSLYTVVEIAAVRAGMAVLYTGMLLYFVTRCIPVKFSEILAIIFRPAVSSLVMLSSVWLLHISGIDLKIITLFIDVFVGIVVYTLTTLVLWQLSGRPEGPEEMILNVVKQRIRAKAG